MRPLSHFGSLVAALAVGVAVTVADGVSCLAGAPTIPAKDVAGAAAPAGPRASTLSAWPVPDLGNPDGHPPAVGAAARPARSRGTSRPGR